MALKSGFDPRINPIASPKTEFKIDLKDQTQPVKAGLAAQIKLWF